jgi:hypothetical protein
VDDIEVEIEEEEKEGCEEEAVIGRVDIGEVERAEGAKMALDGREETDDEEEDPLESDEEEN